MAGQGMVGWAQLGRAGHGRVGAAGQGVVGWAQLGRAGHGKVGTAGQGMAWYGKAGHGRVGWDMVRGAIYMYVEKGPNRIILFPNPVVT